MIRPTEKLMNRNRNNRTLPRPALLALTLALLFGLGAGKAWAASEWKWTQGQGWSEGAGEAKPSAGEQLQYAYQLERNGEYYDAAKQYFLLLRIYPNSKEAGIGLQRLAKCLFDMEDFYSSFKALEQVFQTYPSSGRAGDLVAIEYQIGQKLQTGKYGRLLDENAEESSLRLALEVYEAVLKHDQYGSYADDSLLACGDIQLKLNDAAKAKGYYQRLIGEFPRSTLLDRARLGSTRCDVIMGKATSADVDQMVKDMRARNTLKDEPAQDNSNVESTLNELEELQAKDMWNQIEFYLRRGDHSSVKAAKFLCGELVRRYQRTSYAAKAQRLLPEIVVPKEGKVISLDNFDFNPFRKKSKDPSFSTPQLSDDKVDTDHVIAPVPGLGEYTGSSGSGAEPAVGGDATAGSAPPPLPAPVSTNTATAAAAEPRRQNAEPTNVGPAPAIPDTQPLEPRGSSLGRSAPEAKAPAPVAPAPVPAPVPTPAPTAGATDNPGALPPIPRLDNSAAAEPRASGATATAAPTPKTVAATGTNATSAPAPKITPAEEDSGGGGGWNIAEDLQ